MFDEIEIRSDKCLYGVKKEIGGRNRT
jgi:hypothetical protein